VVRPHGQIGRLIGDMPGAAHDHAQVVDDPADAFTNLFGALKALQKVLWRHKHVALSSHEGGLIARLCFKGQNSFCVRRERLSDAGPKPGHFGRRPRT